MGWVRGWGLFGDVIGWSQQYVLVVGVGLIGRSDIDNFMSLVSLRQVAEGVEGATLALFLSTISIFRGIGGEVKFSYVSIQVNSIGRLFCMRCTLNN